MVRLRRWIVKRYLESFVNNVLHIYVYRSCLVKISLQDCSVGLTLSWRPSSTWVSSANSRVWTECPWDFRGLCSSTCISVEFLWNRNTSGASVSWPVCGRSVCWRTTSVGVCLWKALILTETSNRRELQQLFKYSCKNKNDNHCTWQSRER